MNKKRIVKTVAVATGFLLLCVVPGLSPAQNAPAGSVQTPRPSSPGAQPKLPPDDFAGFDYTDEQKAEIDQIHKDTRARKEAVARDEKLSPDQKDAMILGYTRLEYGQIYKVLTPDQRKQVQMRIRVRREADQAAKKKQPPQK